MATVNLARDYVLTDSTTNADGSSNITRKLVFIGSEDAKITDVITSPLYPRTNSVLPTDTRFLLDNITCNGLGDIPPMFEATARYRYKVGTQKDRNGNPVNADTKPWNMPIQDLESSYSEMETAFETGWRFNATTGDMVPNEPVLNTAGCPIISSRVINIRTISFTFNLKHNGRTPTFNEEPVLNLDDIRVAGILIRSWTGKLMPITSRLMTVYNQSGKGVRWEYWQCRVEIKIHPDKVHGWRRSFLNVGTLALFPTEDASDKLVLGAIYKYTPWKAKEDASNLSAIPTFGSIDDVVKAKNTYAALFGDQGSNEYNAAWARLPWEEITEPMPLTESGTLDIYAITEKANYLTRSYFDCEPVSWRRFSFPEYR